jgi:hypothetical protein
MRDNIENFLTKMNDMLTTDLIRVISNHINKDQNISIIRKQKERKKHLCKEILKLFNTFYSDKNFVLYRNNNNEFVIENVALNPNQQIYLYSNNVTIPSVETTEQSDNNELIPYNQVANEISNEMNHMVLENNTMNTNNELVLFQPTTDIDENGNTIQRRIKLYIVYV